MLIKDKVAVVTGASKGIGRAIALALAERGAHLAISARGKDDLREVEEAIQQMGVRAFAYSGDMSDEKEIKKFISESAKSLGRIDILVNNAGIGIFKPVAELETEDWDAMFNLNVRGLFIATREAIPHLRAVGESVIVNVASLAGKNAIPKAAGYVASKHAVMGFSRSLMLEEREYGVRVLAICPGSVDTSFFDGPAKSFEPKNRKKVLIAQDVAMSVIHMIELPQNAMVSEIDIRPSNPK